MTIAGQQLKDHEEVVDHARAIDQIYKLKCELGYATRSSTFTSFSSRSPNSILTRSVS
ncbi:hypothetical protein DSCA_16050 [Desulfosarcina alkanivorans]|uniref:Uncharacterized protein n=1 Tax=Desulfosarcina alkanivorans TaxID=571177 RepID=A0A5K7YGY3_9BACT|nr:hypothetical protein DSCA_16050 [Desulfosarcina alkanivorans]